MHRNGRGDKDVGMTLFGKIKRTDHTGFPCMECMELTIEGIWYDSQDVGAINICCVPCARTIFAEVGLEDEIDALVEVIK